MTSKQKVINKIIDVEGGDVDDPSDSGGATNFGITENVARLNGYTGKMKDLPRSVAYKIYTAKYWDSVRADDLEKFSESLAHEVVDTAVNMGVSRASKFLQRSLNSLNNKGSFYPDLTVDGQLGPATIRALGEYSGIRGEHGIGVLIKCLDCLQGAYYIELTEKREKDERFLYGWISNRVGS